MKVLSVEEKFDSLYLQMFEELSNEEDNYIEIVDSENITINKSATAIALSIQSAISALISAIVQLLITDEDVADLVASDILTRTGSRIQKRVKIKIENCYNVTITLSAIDIMASVNLLIGILNALMVEADIL
ncbi:MULTISPECIES: spore coat protein [Bacillus]|uniref:spore coat protein n=1 Tax=Bacillus TaxID=1386 RepID=UPI002675E748|nr:MULTISPECIES: spore coat protein [Bacillus]MDO3660103.1 spore coat protein [Bacillus sp. C28GYM-DRY-1]MEC1635621.1 spore coat protein [Bacillus mojavensis]MEC1682788.1 spore coat protein [Bacillus mojavensis]MEC1707176.1 spore coat protein [Bacillus mojavensis]MEC1733559.1 spore coat protein [Bacillus mojavensis]